MSGRELRDFALEIGRDPGVLSRWETGERTPNPEHLAQILTKLGITGKKVRRDDRAGRPSNASSSPPSSTWNSQRRGSRMSSR